MPAISPELAIEKAKVLIPEEVFEAFNELIAERLDTVGRKSHFKLIEVKGRIAEKLGIAGQDFNTKWLNVESAYEAQGWIVKYDEPCIGDTFEAYYEFKYKLTGK